MGGATFSSQKYDFHNLLFNKKVQNLETKIYFRRADARYGTVFPSSGNTGRFVASLPL
ncbi:Uncharacterised protein [Bacteroides thetaiotaomicron]|jgi:hypothetical protein|nr:Uncharacterised protein [Bacteroides thetaiotaomicron]